MAGKRIKNTSLFIEIGLFQKHHPILKGEYYKISELYQHRYAHDYEYDIPYIFPVYTMLFILRVNLGK
jgi:hypothetical protein